MGVVNVPVHVFMYSRTTLLAFSLFHAIHLQCFCLWKLEVNWHWCVKCTRNLLLLLFCISQGRTATYFRCGGKCYISNVANFLLISALKQILKLPNICHTY